MTTAMKIEIKNRYTCAVIFALDEEDLTIKRTVEKAVEAKIDLSGAYLRGAYLRGAYLGGADFNGANGIYHPLACPSDGDFVGWKKLTTQAYDGYLVKLRIPADAKRSSATSVKCRCEFAEVLAIEPIDDAPQVHTIDHNAYGHTTTYTVGQFVRPDKWDENRWNECSNCIHFFCDREAALNW